MLFRSFRRGGVLLHYGTSGEDECFRGTIARPCEVWWVEVVEPSNDFFWWRVGEHEADLTFYLLRSPSVQADMTDTCRAHLSNFVKTELVLFFRCRAKRFRHDCSAAKEYTRRTTPTVSSSNQWCLQRLALFPQFPHDLQMRISDRKSTRLNSSHSGESRMPSSA